MQIVNVMSQTSTIYPYEGETPKGPLYASEYNSICRFEKTTIKMRDSDGKDFYGNGRLFLPYNSITLAIQKDTKVVVNGEAFIIKRIDVMYGFSPSHLECVVV